MKRKAIQNEFSMEDYEKNLVGCYIDPPTGWMYGFPCEFKPKEGQTLRDFVEEKGYPMKDWDDWAKNYVRVWRDNK